MRPRVLTHSACTKSLHDRELTQASHGIFKYVCKVQSSNSSTRGNGDLQRLGDHPGALKSAAKKPRLGDQPGATSRERIGGDGDGTGLLGVVRAMSSGDMLVILVLSSIHHTKSEMCGAFRALAERPRAHTTTLCRCASCWPSIVNVRLLLHPHLVTTLLPTARLIWVQVQSTPVAMYLQ